VCVESEHGHARITWPMERGRAVPELYLFP
jgi:hypothetical protein